MDNHWREYFTFTKKERVGILVLLLLIAIVTLLSCFFTGVDAGSKVSLDQYEQQLVKALSSADSSLVKEANEYAGVYYEPKKADALFNFDPNTIDAAAWKKLGLRDKTIRTIQNYLAKGGRFKQPGDLANIYGLHKDEFERLLPYIRIPATATIEQASKPVYRKPAYQKALPAVIEINDADTTAFIALPGIGSKLAWRIVNFRDKLGGFYTVDQLGETYGLPDSVFQVLKAQLKCTSPVIRTININTADVNTLKMHPYIKWNVANAIVQYRGQHSNYKTVAEIQQIAIITPEIFQKLAPYLSVE